MIRGFIINRPEGSTFGVCLYGSEVPDKIILEDIAEEADVPIDCIEIVDAEDLIDEQYDGMAFLSMDAGL